MGRSLSSSQLSTFQNLFLKMEEANEILEGDEHL